jgi:Flp pilus assembly protein TadD
MLSRTSLWAGLVGISVTISLVQTIAVAKTPPEIGEIAKAITVLIADDNGQGSGVILQRQGDIYTVLTDEIQHQIISNSIQLAPGNLDLAVIKFRSINNYPIAKVGNSNAKVLKMGMDLYLVGFSKTKMITNPTPLFSPGRVSANSNQLVDDGYSLIYNIETIEEMSGGGVLNSEGELVAIHGRADRDKDGRSIRFNQGTPIHRFAAVASSMGVELNQIVAPTSKTQTTSLSANYYLTLANQQHKKKNYRESVALLDRAIQIDPTNANIYNNRAYWKANNLLDIQGALLDYNRAIQFNPTNASAYHNRGYLKANNLEDIQGALLDYDRAIQFDSTNTIAYNNRGELKANKLQDIQGALLDYNRAIQLDDKNAVAYHNRGYLKANNLQDIQGGLTDLSRAIQLNPIDAVAFYNRGLSNSKIGNFQSAVFDMQQAMSLYQQQGNNRDYQRAALLFKQWKKTMDNSVFIKPNQR